MADVEDSYVLETLPAVRAMQGLRREIDDTTRALQRSENVARSTEASFESVGRARGRGGRFGGGGGGGGGDGGILETLGVGGAVRRGVGSTIGRITRAGGGIAAAFLLNREIAKKIAADRDPENIRDQIVRRAVQLREERATAEIPAFIRNSSVGRALSPFGQAFIRSQRASAPSAGQALGELEQEATRKIEEASDAKIAARAAAFATSEPEGFFSVRAQRTGFRNIRSIGSTLGW